MTSHGEPSWFSLQAPRRGHSLDECDDACAADPARGRFAVADGAAESADAGAWARALVAAFLHSPEPLDERWVTAARERWAARIEGPGEVALPWYLEEHQRLGAFATWLGVVVAEDHWRAVAVGDSCLFHVRQGELLAAFPIDHSSHFDNAPHLIGSRATSPLDGWASCQGDWQPGDRLWLMTDALAQWFLYRHEAGARPADELDALREASAAQFAEWVEARRNQRQLRNDDATLVGIAR